MKKFSLAEAIHRRPQAAFAAFLLVHGLVWTALPALLYANLPLDLIEGLTYGREWQLGYDKLPPLPWFVIEAAYRMFHVDTAYYALAQFAVIVAFVAVWITARPLVGAAGALVAILIIDGLDFFNYTAPKFNHDVIQLPFWALAGFAFHAGLRQRRLAHWALAGLALGVAAWAKYFVVILAIPLALFLVIDRDARRRLAEPGPWFAAVIAFVVSAPHLIWLVQNSFLPFHYLEARAPQPRGALDHLLHPMEYLGGQAFLLIPTLSIAAPLMWPTKKVASPAEVDGFDRRIITLLAFGPALTLLVLTLVTGRGTVTMWGFPLWLFLGLWIVLFAPAALDRTRLGWIGALWAIVSATFITAFVVNYLVLPRFDHRDRAVLFPGYALSGALTQRFEAATGRKPDYIIGSIWDGGNVAHYSSEHPQPRVLIDGLPRRAPWIDLEDLRARGAVLVWTKGDLQVLPKDFAEVAPNAQVGLPFDLPFQIGHGVVHVGWAILPPQSR
jgi:4-amino-4-deoxy-L-arabinose transferase-like glycosyltransferase